MSETTQTRARRRTVKKAPCRDSHFGRFGGQYVPETLMVALAEVEQAFNRYFPTRAFQKELRYYLQHYVGRPTPLYYAERLSAHVGGPRIYLKREDLAHTGAHKINNTIGQMLLARRMGKQRVIARPARASTGWRRQRSRR